MTIRNPYAGVEWPEPICWHDNTSISICGVYEHCKDCLVTWEYCHECTIAGNDQKIIYHLPPMCAKWEVEGNLDESQAGEEALGSVGRDAITEDDRKRGLIDRKWESDDE